jgi:hypothetical protein
VQPRALEALGHGLGQVRQRVGDEEAIQARAAGRALDLEPLAVGGELLLGPELPRLRADPRALALPLHGDAAAPLLVDQGLSRERLGLDGALAIERVLPLGPLPRELDPCELHVGVPLRLLERQLLAVLLELPLRREAPLLHQALGLHLGQARLAVALGAEAGLHRLEERLVLDEHVLHVDGHDLDAPEGTLRVGSWPMVSPASVAMTAATTSSSASRAGEGASAPRAPRGPPRTPQPTSWTGSSRESRCGSGFLRSPTGSVSCSRGTADFSPPP